ncbi:MAG: translation initiation factor IF-2 [Phycisphaerales bacterium]|nr:translation initiation factor IF-2 [Phycisphaerales bacterium]
MASKRISDIAKEIGVASKLIIQKCVDEGVPADKVKSHASVVSAGLEASIREWFSTGAVATAVETKQHVDVDAARSANHPRKRTSAKGEGDHHDEGHDAGTDSTTATVPHVTPSIPTGHAHTAPSAHTGSPVVVPHKPTSVPEPRTVDAHATAHPAASAPAAPAAPGTTQTPPAAPGAPTGTTPGTPPATPNQSHLPVGLRTGFRVAPMNVPTRPTNVQQVGQAMGVKAKVTLAGPKVVRIEAPEQMPERRPPRTGGPGGYSGSSPGMRTGTGARPPGGGDDPTRRNLRRGPSRPGQGGPAVPPKRKIRDPKNDTSTEGRTGFTEADLAEREERLARSSGLLKQRRREAKARLDAQGRQIEEFEGRVEIVAPFTIKELAAASGIKGADVIKKLFMQGVMATINTAIDPVKAQEIMIDFDIELVVIQAKTAEQEVESQFTDRKMIDERPRSPIVTIMGHVDHGKTSLLDAIRKAKVAEGEAGGITQKTSAFKVPVEVNGVTKSVVFIDTPGHEAFTEMRARGANVTDAIVLVVGAPEGVMPQTVESINHAKAAGAPIIVALNKIDSPQATENQIQKVYGQLAEHNLSPTQWGGSTEVIHTSALKGTGIKELLEILELQAEILQLKADFQGNARGRVIEAGQLEGRGPIATIMVQDGELKVGDFIVVGRAFGRVRDITDDQGKRIKIVGPSTPVQVSGIDEIPNAGDAFFVTSSLKQAEEAAEQRRIRDRETSLHQPKVTLDGLFSQMKDASVKEILIVLKADVQGSVDVIKNQIEKLSTAEVKVRVLHSAVGGIQESDIVLAHASSAVVVGFNVIPSGKARSEADRKSVEVRTYQVIYDIVDDVKKAASGLLEPEIRQEVLGHADVRQVFKVTKVGTIAGCYVTDGSFLRDALIRVTRNGIVIEQDRVLEQLKRFKDDAKEVKMGMECGMKIVGYDDIKQGDVLECYKKVEIKRTL